VKASDRGDIDVLGAPAVERRRWVRDAFHNISSRYDLLNHVLSGGIHLLWKRAAVQATHLGPGDVGLDVCCGTGDLVAGMAKAVGARGHAIGLDFAPGMLEIAARRLGGLGLADRVTLICGDAETLPLADDSVNAATFAFGLRNVAQPERSLRDVYRVLKPRGRLVILEFSQPPSKFMRTVYDFYSQTIIPRVGGWLSGRRDAYQYLHDSIRQWPDPEQLSSVIRSAGFPDVRYRLQTAGIAALHLAVKP
jgi:demethylmenaquinone methyltransferase/2-methoxy-6-polyprenyl-1,4-benzoquinol methylase